MARCSTWRVQAAWHPQGALPGTAVYWGLLLMAGLWSRHEGCQGGRSGES